MSSITCQLFIILVKLILGKTLYNTQWMYERLHSTDSADLIFHWHHHCNIGHARFEGLEIKIFVSSG